jgi:APA family basic amino acid/polyamine antiporter
VALVGSIFSADAWNNVTFTGGEIDKPERNLPLSLIMGTGVVLAVYIFINWVYLKALPFEAIQTAENDV